jgi:two-component system CheB/CheR fusion protein
MSEQPLTNFPVLGIGAAAGGFESLEAFFNGFPADVELGMACVMVQNLAEEEKRLLSGIIERSARMPVFEAADGMTVEKNCAYVLPPGRGARFSGGAFKFHEPDNSYGQILPVDYFFKYLATDIQERAIGIILSGNGSDGTMGIRAIKGEGGITLAQTPKATEFFGMSQSAINTGLVDFILPAADMAKKILDYTRQVFAPDAALELTPMHKKENALKKIFVLLRIQTGHDFSQYKMSTIQRRIDRRLAVNQIEEIDEYVRLLQQNQGEVEALFRDLLIGVTNFFRNPEAFRVLEEQAITQIFADKNPGAAIRVWSTGCSTGEEAYSLAILLQERMEALKQSYTIQVFATDIDSNAIATARAGIYNAAVTSDISPERLARFFTVETLTAEGVPSCYRINRSIRDMLVFSEQDLIKDPPFSRLDLIVCRNLMIYLGANLQKKLIPLFHYSLLPNGILFLGSSETVGEHVDLFSIIDRKAKLFRRKAKLFAQHRLPLGVFQPPLPPLELAVPGGPRKMAMNVKIPLRDLAEQALLLQLSPSAALVNTQGDILYLHGRTGKYLEMSPGEAGINNVLKMAREGFKYELSIALHNVAAGKDVERIPGLRVRADDPGSKVNLTVAQVVSSASLTPLFLIIFEDADPYGEEEGSFSDLTKLKEMSSTLVAEYDMRIEELKRELCKKEEYLNRANEDLESSNEELKSSNEEMQSVNEELQSTNEELETSKEELQSVNEELSTVNAELQSKVNDLSLANNDMNNLLAGTGIATIFVDNRLNVLRFTPSATRLINLIPNDIGRPLAHILSNLIGYNKLVSDIRFVLETLSSREVEVETQDLKWFSLRIQPYRTLENVIEGAVITFVDITDKKNVEESCRESEALFKSLYENSLSAVMITEIVTDADGAAVDYILRQANPAFTVHTGKRVEEVLDKRTAQVFPGIENTVMLGIFGKVELSGRPVSFKSFSADGKRKYNINAYQVGKGRFAVVFENITDRGEVVP